MPQCACVHARRRISSRHTPRFLSAASSTMGWVSAVRGGAGASKAMCLSTISCAAGRPVTLLSAAFSAFGLSSVSTPILFPSTSCFTPILFPSTSCCTHASAASAAMHLGAHGRRCGAHAAGQGGAVDKKAAAGGARHDTRRRAASTHRADPLIKKSSLLTSFAQRGIIHSPSG